MPGSHPGMVIGRGGFVLCWWGRFVDDNDDWIVGLDSPNVGTYPRCVRFHRQSETKGDGEMQPFNCWDVFISDCCRGIGKEYWEIIQANEKAGINNSPSVGTYPRCVRFHRQSETKGGEIQPFNCWGVFISDCCRGIGRTGGTSLRSGIIFRLSSVLGGIFPARRFTIFSR